MKMYTETGNEIRIVQADGLDTADMGEEKVMMNISKGKYYVLNSVGSRIWKLIETPQSFSDIISKLTEEYDVNTQTCRDSVMKFIDRMYDEGLISIC